MYSLRDAAFAVRGEASGGGWSLVQAAGRPMWPAFPSAPLKVREFCQRFARSGHELRLLATGTTNLWAHMDRGTLVAQVRDRLRDPGLINQKTSQLCGPTSVTFEFARRDPVRYVKAVRQLLEQGKFDTAGEAVEAEEDLRERPVPPSIAQVDWLLVATMRDDANVTEDVDDGTGLEAYTLWGGMRDWTRDVLRLPGGGWETCFHYGESDVMQKMRGALDAGGVAFLLIDSNLLKDGEDDDEEDIWFRRAKHKSDKGLLPFGTKRHSEDDAFPPDHWVALLDGLHVGSDPEDSDPVTLRVWSWASEYEISGTVEALGEYLYAGVWGFK